MDASKDVHKNLYYHVIFQHPDSDQQQGSEIQIRINGFQHRINQKQMQGNTTNENIICEKGKLILAIIAKKTPGSSTNEEVAFKASHGWFQKFKRRIIYNAVSHGEASSSETNAAKNFISVFKKLLILRVTCRSSSCYERGKRLSSAGYAPSRDIVDWSVPVINDDYMDTATADYGL
ncbi:hypothetical protein X975_16723, partial [Stegodyphus mimosarum]